MALGMSGGLRKRESSGLTMERSGGALAASLRELRVFVFPAARVEGALALLHEPQAHDVLEQAIGAVQPAFVGQVQLLGARRTARPS